MDLETDDRKEIAFTYHKMNQNLRTRIGDIVVSVENIVDKTRLLEKPKPIGTYQPSLHGMFSGKKSQPVSAEE